MAGNLLCRVLKKTDPDSMPALYLEALQTAFQRHLEDRASSDSRDDFLALGTRLAQSYAGFNASTPALVHIVQHGIDYALEVGGMRNLGSQSVQRMRMVLLLSEQVILQILQVVGVYTCRSLRCGWASWRAWRPLHPACRRGRRRRWQPPSPPRPPRTSLQMTAQSGSPTLVCWKASKIVVSR